MNLYVGVLFPVDTVTASDLKMKELFLTAISDYNRLTVMMDGDSSEDYAITHKKASVGRRRSSATSSPISSSVSPTSVRSNSASKKRDGNSNHKRQKAKKRRMLSLDDEEDEDYEDDGSTFDSNSDFSGD